MDWDSWTPAQFFQNEYLMFRGLFGVGALIKGLKQRSNLEWSAETRHENIHLQRISSNVNNILRRGSPRTNWNHVRILRGRRAARHTSALRLTVVRWQDV